MERVRALRSVLKDESKCLQAGERRSAQLRGAEEGRALQWGAAGTPRREAFRGTSRSASSVAPSPPRDFPVLSAWRVSHGARSRQG